jgi:dihydroorotate dehydrogenase
VTSPAETARAGVLGAVVSGVRLPFAAMNAAGTASTASDVRTLARSRTGAIVMMPVTVRPFVHPSFRTLQNPGFDKILPLVGDLAAAEGRAPVVASIAGASIEEFAVLAKSLGDAGAAAIEADLVHPWVEATVAPFDGVEVLAALAERLATATSRPVWVKIPELPRIRYAALVTLLLDAGVRGVVVRNDFNNFERLVLEAPRPIDVIAFGGIASGYDVTRALAKGARAVQVDAPARTEGPSVFARLEREMRKAAGGQAPAA